ncbi:class I adenylate-forming enzyme family protein [uncultured Modestobacter sp.]|uniref:class I adenylate-forming enzyme family protein n=1 Tax=uncultured Modestobacter sp. TaxID=380048 RepID=UPI00260ECE35|nr:fatty acid--CoA ligase family protein [uncultured Modestobacter sp.]
MAITLLLDLAESMDPERLAVGLRQEEITAQRLSALTTGGAALIAASGARSVAFIGVNSPAFPVAMFAAARAGVPIAPLNYRLAEGALQELVARLDAPLVVVDEAYLPVVSGCGVPVLVTSEFMARCATEPAVDLPDVDDADPAVLLFTSGTTAAPKCVVLRHQNLQSYVLQTVEPGSAAEGDSALVSVPTYHVAGVGTVLTNVFAGRRLLYLPNFTPRSWLDLVRQEEVSFAMLVPTMLARILDELGGEVPDLPALRTLAYGGARMPQPVLERALRAFPAVDFVNAYGLTETSSTIAVLGPEDHRIAFSSDDPAVRARLGSVGRLIPGMEGQVRDFDRVVPAGEEGELWVRGEQVSGEYEGQGSVLDEAGWFPTRDRARMDEDGYVFVLGRSDDVIIRGGENIAPAEVEDVLLRHPGVAEVAVIGLPDEEWGECLAAVVVPATGAACDVEELREWVRSRLRSAKTPDRIVFRGELPHTDTGKLLRRKLYSEFTTAPAGS